MATTLPFQPYKVVIGLPLYVESSSAKADLSKQLVHMLQPSLIFIFRYHKYTHAVYVQESLESRTITNALVAIA